MSTVLPGIQANHGSWLGKHDLEITHSIFHTERGEEKESKKEDWQLIVVPLVDFIHMILNSVRIGKPPAFQSPTIPRRNI